jgi:uncharacterized membrane protein
MMWESILTEWARLNAMPPGNVTGMTGEERALIAAWLATDRR